MAPSSAPSPAARDLGSLPGQVRDFRLTCSRAACGCRKLKADWLETGRRALAAPICVSDVSLVHTEA